MSHVISLIHVRSSISISSEAWKAVHALKLSPSPCGIQWNTSLVAIYHPSTFTTLYVCILYEFCYRSVFQYWWSCTPSHYIGLYFWGVRGSWVECDFLFSLVYQLYLVIGICFKQHFDTRYLAFSNLSPPRMFCPWTFFQNMGFNIVPSNPFMSHLATQLGYSAGVFQALLLIVFAAFGVVD